MIEQIIKSNQLGDMREAYRQMQLPTVMRMREARAQEDGHPLLAMRLTLMNASQERMANLAADVLRNPLNVHDQGRIDRFKREFSRATDSCMRVLECTADATDQMKVASAASAMAVTMQHIQKTLVDQQSVLAKPVAVEVANMLRISESVQEISVKLRNAYEEMILSVVPQRAENTRPAAEAPNNPAAVEHYKQ
jgi:methyl-accepting chemotaxis protein